ncbi:hypothetical protein ACQUW5_15160 [Legionella sp. CNM-1927-20]|uniref:hypothetical protein n=1 Tax=Legionella sp. CNM-1927-20 TaxID=3422221 RepID=UPI00403ACABC
MPEIPKKIHFVWVSKPVPKKYLLSILNLAHLAKKSGFELTLWMDKDSDFYKTIANNDIFIPQGLINIRNIETLLMKARNDPFYKTPEIQNLGGEKQLESYLGREAVGNANPAARKDLLVPEILRQEGGYYFDTDTIFLIQFVDFMVTQLQSDNAELGFKAGLVFDKFAKSFSEGNDILGSVQNHEILKQLIIDIFTSYKQFDEHTSLLSFYGVPDKNKDLNLNKHKLTLMDKKRKIQEERLNSGYLTEDRFNLTIKGSGPEVLCNTLQKYSKEHSIENPQAFTFPTVEVHGRRRLKGKRQGGGLCFEVMGVKVQSNSDQSWLRVEPEEHFIPKKKTSFEYHTSPSFFSKKRSRDNEQTSDNEQASKKVKMNPDE